MSYSREKSQPIFDRALNVLVKGVSSNFRYLGDKETPVIVKGKGAQVWDADNNEFIDYRLGWGPIILGHADDRVNSAVAEAIQNGTTFAATTSLEVETAELVKKMVPGMEKLRFTNTGTEATMHALRTARGFTNKEKFIKTLKDKKIIVRDSGRTILVDYKNEKTFDNSYNMLVLHLLWGKR